MSILAHYLDYTDGTEPPKQYHRWSFITCVASALGRNIWMRHGHGEIYPNIYCILVGAPGTRKSSAIKTARKLLEGGGYTKFAFDKSSKQKFLLDFQAINMPRKADGEFDMEAALESNIKPNSTDCFICADEFADFIGTNNFDFLTLLTNLWDNKDKYEDRVKNSQSVFIENPTINLLGGVTPTSFTSSIPQEASGSGFLSRVILVYGEPSNIKITWPEPPNVEDTAGLKELFKQLQNVQGEVRFTPAAKRMVSEIYTEWENLADVRLQYYGSRRLTHLFKLCMVLAALDCVERDTTVPEVSAELVEEANTILTFTEEGMSTAMGEMGRSKNSEATQKIMEQLGNSGKPISVDELWRSVSQDLDKFTQLTEIIINLKRAKKIVVNNTTDEASGVSKSTVMLRQERMGKDKPYVNYPKYIQEYAGVGEKLTVLG